MKFSKFDRKIRRLRRKEEKLIAKMDSLRRRFLMATDKFIPSWYSKYVEHVVTSYPEVTKVIELDGLKCIKSELQELIEDVRVVAKGKLSCEDLWSQFYKETQIALEDYVYNIKRPRMLDDIIRWLLVGVIRLLARHGYEDAANELETSAANPLRRDNRLDWSSEMDTIIESYSDLHKALSDVIGEIKNIESERILAEAKDLWERA